MKTSKWLILILAVALLAGYYFIGSDYFKQRWHHATLASQMSETQTMLVQVPIPHADLEQQLAAARDTLKAAETYFTADTNDTHIVNAVLHMAAETGVSAVPLNTTGWVTETVSDRDYSVFRLDLQVTGTFNQMASFLGRLETGKLETLVIEYLNVEKIPDDFIDSNDAGTAPVSANIKLAVYALPPGTG